VALTRDALGRPATRTAASVTDTYGYQGTSDTVTTLVGATTRVNALAADGSRVAEKDGSTTGFLLPDLHGNVIAAEQSAGTTIAVALRYDGYGQTLGTPYSDEFWPVPLFHESGDEHGRNRALHYAVRPR
jgi:hypothetical protein